MLKLTKVKLKNFRCYEEETELCLGTLTTVIGRNDSGKSSFLDALSIFFENEKMDQGDLNINCGSKEVTITCEFENFPRSIVLDENYPTTLGDEYLLNSSDKLEIKKIYDCSLKKPKVERIFAIALHPTDDSSKDLLGLKNAELKKRLVDLKVDPEGIKLTVNTQLRAAIRKSSKDLKIQETEIDLEQGVGKDIWKNLKTELPIFFLFKVDRSSTDQDSEAQDPMKAAVIEALKAQEESLSEITKKVEAEVKKIADRTVEKIREMDPSLAGKLKPTFSPPKWDSVFKISLTGDDEIPLNKRGSGVRRLVLLNFFRAKAEQRADEKNASGVIYAIEEPETSQHPDSQRKIVNAFIELSEAPNCQVLLTTHTPMLARLLPVDCLRFIEVGDQRRVHNTPDDATKQLVASALGVLPDHDVKLFIGVEGSNDINFLKNISKTLNRSGASVPDLTSLEESGEIIFFPLGGCNLALWKSRLAGLNRPEFYLFDRDVGEGELCPKQKDIDSINERENCKAVVTSKKEIENYIHQDAIKSAREIELTFGAFDDVPELAAKTIHKRSESETEWEDLEGDKRKKKESLAKKWLNSEAVFAMTPDLLKAIDPGDDVVSWLGDIDLLLNAGPRTDA